METANPESSEVKDKRETGVAEPRPRSEQAEGATSVASAACDQPLLVVDDEDEVRGLVVRTIRELLGWQCLEACNGEEALEILGSQPVGIVVTDMKMPGIDGPELLIRIKSELPDVDVVAMTGHTEEYTLTKLIESGASGFLAKPFSAKALEATLLRVNKERQLIRELKQKDGRLRASEQRYRMLFELSMDGIVLAKMDGLQIIDANREFLRLAECPLEEARQRSFLEFCFEDEQHRVRRATESILKHGVGRMADVMMVKRSGEACFVDISATVMEIDGEKLVHLSTRDVTSKREILEDLASAAITDALTGLYNYRYFYKRLSVALARCTRQNHPISLVMFDVDRFKACNDTYGHVAGDEILSRVGEIVRHQTRQHVDEGFRYGGDEFAVIMCEAGKDTSGRVAERIRQAFEVGDNKGTSLSIGVVQYNGESSPEQFVSSADKAMYEAKVAGGNRVHVTS